METSQDGGETAADSKAWPLDAQCGLTGDRMLSRDLGAMGLR
jgi:hypothetical protein